MSNTQNNKLILRKLFQLKINSQNRSLIFALLACALVKRTDILIAQISAKPYGLIRVEGSTYYEIDSPSGVADYTKLTYLSRHSTSIKGPATIVTPEYLQSILSESDLKIADAFYKQLIENSK